MSESDAAATGTTASAGTEVGAARALALCAAGWVLPGAGHLLLGRFRRGLVFAFLVLGSFGLGLAHDGRLAISMQLEEEFGLGIPGTGLRVSLSTLQAVAGGATGPADFLARRFVYGEVVYALPRVSSERRERLLETFRSRERSTYAPYGTAYLLTAGLMNLLLILDVWDIARGRKP